MAEIAGLVIGGVSMAALVDGCMRTFDRLESARTYGRDYGKASLKLSLLQLRFSRWVESLRMATNRSPGLCIGTPEEAEVVKDLLGEIVDDIEKTRKFAERYHGPEEEGGGKEVVAMEALALRVRGLALQRQRSSTFGQKTRWALRDQRKFKKLLEGLGDAIGSLEEMFPVEKFPGVGQAKQELVVAEATKLVQPAEVEEVGDDDETIVVSLLDEASGEVDESLKKAVEDVAQKTRVGRHVYGDISTSENARVQVGDFVGKGHQVTGQGHMYGKLTAGGSSRVHYGDSFGGKSVFDD